MKKLTLIIAIVALLLGVYNLRLTLMNHKVNKIQLELDAAQTEAISKIVKRLEAQRGDIPFTDETGENVQ